MNASNLRSCRKCGARRRDGGVCQAPAVGGASGNGRCRVHGGNALAWGFAPRWRVSHGSIVREMVAAGVLPEGTKSAPASKVLAFLEVRDSEGCETREKITSCDRPHAYATVSPLEKPRRGADVWEHRAYRLLRSVSMGYTVKETVRELGISRATLYRWLAEDSSLADGLAESRRVALLLKSEGVRVLAQRFGSQEAYQMVAGKALPKARRRRARVPGGVARLLPEYLF
jgi:transposase-like protein